MNHDDAIGVQVAERYVAGELSPRERDAFEAHFFDCPDCAAEVRWEQTFAANARAVAREEAGCAVAAGAVSFTVHFPAPGQYESCSYEILDATGRGESSGVLPVPVSHQSEWYLEIPVHPIPPGDHILIVRDAGGNQVLARFTLHIVHPR